MPKFTKDGLTIETAVPREAAELRRDGFIEQKAKTAEAVKPVAPTADIAATPKSTK